MAISLSTEDKNIRVIAFVDPAIEGTTREEYEDYLKDLNENKLKMVEGQKPTKFVLKVFLDYKDAQKVKSGQTRTEGRDIHFDLSYTMEEVRRSLIGIENPGPGLTFARDKSDGKADKNLIARLESASVVGDLALARANALKGQGSEDAKKN